MKRLALIGISAIALTVTGCRVGPNYVRPAATATPPSFKEQPPSTFSAEGWKVAQPADMLVKGDWWTMFGDAQLNALEAQVDPANQSLRAAEANYRAAAADVAFYRANRAPTVGVAPAVSTVRNSSNQPYFNQNSAAAGANGVGNLSLPFSLNYEVDLWGRVRRSIQQAGDQAQATAADRENIRLSLHAELANDYLDLRAADAQKKLLHETVGAFLRALQLTQDRYDGGAAPLSDVSQARVQLQSAQVQETDVDVQRAQLEHAIAVLIGKAPADLSIPRTPVTVAPPVIPDVPGMLPSQLLERRPDIASAERRMAASNEQIGIAEAAFYPTLSISAAAGFVGTSAVNWFTWPSRFFAVGPTLSQTLYDHGRRRSLTDIARANYDSTVADYQQTTLEAFQQVEDNLAALHQLEVEAEQQRGATASAQQSLDLFNVRYEGGVDTYLQVITWQTSLLQNQRNDIDIQRGRLADTVLLIKALGGGWNQASLPKP
ncbi:efflux transporter, outer membrane factor lipoprotein, NodT family [Terriglobus roseus DSM 18391]|uniref:Efflux transporter, outer membrane factor lipoprotein, NodT family n=1 Tax=Terriglobus roseus (strain DSM 18391 / NRRL B-41598 / KBS 63) TaxID=926566 RepID=I3ZED4_TERRK|nr:efflux transporter outer membrane subunit [Terriglobus roseus]AFL87602.1 efflux transporter, outer membrane factor lipoprotein, NodT family [Terriglobus roseus DSM 18391]